ncbi:MAG: hypothetical protein F6K50_14825 [Moorea sp. SIO3I7]|uniref:hypothetical protein n=1 Tax=Moorena sp. SIO3I8 TaxID=2607833 RepID=UPI0013BECDBD|nr:hypothetical protein [Moorena sp. SIO3I8]NEN96756.1 hypothetical protein [Moorena sp. SIO3I7]NEO09622.1 hypothetical protein [Moorena sp. SIO3I8]
MAELKKEIEQHPKKDEIVVNAYNNLCDILDKLNEKLKKEAKIEGESGPITRTWQRINKS